MCSFSSITCSLVGTPPSSTGPQKPPKAELAEAEWCDAKKNALSVNLARAERDGNLNLGLGPEWEKK